MGINSQGVAYNFGQLVINEVIYNSFVWVTLGCFGISSFEKVKGK